MPTLTSRRHKVEDVEATEFCFQQGWTDGLPVIPPTEDRVWTMLNAAGLKPEDQIGYIDNRAVSVSAEKVALNAVMAGCRPEYMRVVVAAVQGICDPRWSYHGPGTSTGGAGESCVTVCGCDAPHNVNDHGSTTADGLVANLAGVLGTPGSNNVYLAGEPLIVLGPEHARTIADSGWTKADLKRALWERARVRLDVFSPENLARFALIDPPRFTNRPPGADVAQAQRPEDLMVIVVGGPGKHSAIIPTFGATRAVTVRIDA